MPRVRPNRARKRSASFFALTLAPVLAAGAVVVGTSTDVLSGDSVSLAADGPITLRGHGHGHGRGMGQWGAFGYAKQGWSADRILNHYYGGTTAGKVSNPDVTVSLSEKSSVNVRADAGMRVAGQEVAPGQAVSLSGGTASITEGCGGNVVRSVPAQWVEPLNAAPNRPANELLTFCGTNDAYRGAIGLDGGKVVNKLHVDDYVKGVIPKESFPAWADQGGFEALKAQAVAARTYVVSGLERGRAIDNTQNSQMYHGVQGEDPRTNRAADATAGDIRLQNGKAAFTEFSASTGGYTAGGEFPAVVDAGDAISPTHEWTATISPSAVAAAYPSVGSVQSVEVIEANGLGAGSGRAIKVRVTGTGGSVEDSAMNFRNKLGLKSDWFSVDGQRSMPKIVRPPVGPADPGNGSLDLGDLTALLGQIPGLNLNALGLPGISALGELSPLLQQLLSAGTEAIGAKLVALDRSDNANGSLGTVSRDRSDNSNGSTGTVSRDRSDNSNGSTGTVSEPELVTDGNGVQGLIQVLQNGVIFFSPQTGAHALFGQALTDYLERGGLAVLGFPHQDLLN